MQTCNICNNHYQSELAYKTHLKTNKKCILLRNGNSTLNCRYCNELKSTQHFLDIHTFKCPKRIEMLETENARLLEENKLLKQSKSKTKLNTLYTQLYPITTESLAECFKKILNDFKYVTSMFIYNLKRIQNKHLLEYLVNPLKIIVCDLSRNKYEIRYNDRITIDMNLNITKKIIKQFLQNTNNNIHTELYTILQSKRPTRNNFKYEEQQVSYKDLSDFIASDFSHGEYIDEFFQSVPFKTQMENNKRLLYSI